MRVMSYNVNGFKGNKDSLINMQLINMHENLNKIEAFIKGFLLGDIDNLVILQEVPLKDNAICYKKIIEKFKDYKFICSYNVSYANFITVAIANNKSKWVEKHDFYNTRKSNDYLNRFIEVYNEEYKLQVLGLHIPCNKKDINEIKKFWDEIISYKKSYSDIKSDKSDISLMLVGDMNAEHNESSVSTFKESLNQLFLNEIELIEGATFKGKRRSTNIDHMLIHKPDNSIEEYAKGSIINSIDYSDHYPILSPPIKKVTDRKLKKLY